MFVAGFGGKFCRSVGSGGASGGGFGFTDVAVVMGSKSDLRVMQGALDVLSALGVSAVANVVSAHRTPERMFEFAKNASGMGYKVIIAGAGGAAHLPGMVASLTSLPVIGVPINVTGLSGIDSLLSIVQMPKGIPVATVAIDGAENAGLLAASMLAIHDDRVQRELKSYRDGMRDKSASSSIVDS